MPSDTNAKRGRCDPSGDRGTDPERPASDRSSRAQTTIDFLIAIGTFVVVVGFVFSFTPGITVPFLDGQSAHPLIADRAATHLASDELTDVDSPGELDSGAVKAFFELDDDPNVVLGIETSRSVRVEIVDRNGDIIIHNDVELARGPEPPARSGRVTIARRTVALDGEPCRLEEPTESCSLSVRVW